MFSLKKALLWAVSVIFVSTTSYAGEIGHIPISSDTHTFPHIAELKPAPGSFQVAKATFLPELKDSENGWSGSSISNSANKGNNCSGYELTSCPAHGSCSSCPFDRRYKRLISCANGYTRKGNSCKAASCSAIGYRSDIPANQICTKINEDDLTCYKDCRAVSCSMYMASCSNKPAHATTVSKCPDCKDTANSNCGDNVCMVGACETNYKLNGDMTGCILKDDTCPDGYFKTCETGTQGYPKFTELGSSCYQCKPNKQPWEICAEKINASYPGYGVLTSTSVPSQGKGYVVVKDLTLSKLPGNVIYGAKHFNSISECASLNPTLTVKTANVTSEDISDSLTGTRTMMYVNRFENFDIEDVNIHYDLTLENSYSVYPILVYAKKTTASKLKNATFSFSGSTFSSLISFHDSGQIYNTSYKLTLDIEGNVKFGSFSSANYLPRLHMIRDWTILNVKPGANLEFPGMDMAGMVIIDNATVKAVRIATSQWIKDKQHNLILKNNASLYLSDELHLESNIGINSGSQLITRFLETYLAQTVTLSGNNSSAYLWNPTTDQKSLIRKATSSDKCIYVSMSSGSSNGFDITQLSTVQNHFKCCSNSNTDNCGLTSSSWVYDCSGGRCQYK